MTRNVAEGFSRKAAHDLLQKYWSELGAGMDPELSRELELARRQQAPAPTPQRVPRNTRVDPVAEARIAASAASTLEALFEAITAFPYCPLKADSRSTVTHDGPLNAPVMVIGEGPGAEEDRRGKPFVGKAGQLLDRMLAAIGLSRETNAFITNVNYWRPPNNADPSDEVLSMTLPFVRRMIALKKPTLIIAAGKVPTRALLDNSSGIMSLRGQEFTFESDAGRIPFLPIFHPAFLLRQPKMKAAAWRDLQSIETRLKALGVL